MTMEGFARGAAHAFELAGIVAMLAGALLAGGRFVQQRGYHAFRKDLARSILLGLELMIAADIIATITVRPTLSSVLVLAVIVLVRTFLSFTLELEATGRFPWQRDAAPVSSPADTAG